MSDYTKSVNFTAKDALPTGDSGKVIRGSEFDTEFNAVSTAIASKADKAGPTFTGTTTMAGLTVSGTFTLGGTAITATAVELNKLDGVTATTAELNYVDGVTSNVQTQLDAKADLASPDFTGTVGVNTVDFSDVAAGVIRIKKTAGTGSFFFNTNNELFAIGAYAGISTTTETPLFAAFPSGSSYLVCPYSGSSTGLFIHTYGATTNNTFPLRFFVDTVERGWIQSNSTGTTYNTSSDSRLKENVVDAPTVTDKLSNIKIRSFDWKETGQHQEYGVIAQEVLEVFPEVVAESPEGMYSVDYSRFVPMLIQEIQALRKEVDELKGMG